jgi:pre-mRNA-splicing helicase BRR2
MEVIVSRMRYISVQTEQPIRIVALGASLANGRDVAEWIGASTQSTFNFHPSVRPVPLEIHIQGYNIPHFASLMLAMTKPCYNAINSYAAAEPVIVFVSSRKQSRLTAVELLTLCIAETDERKFLHCSEKELEPMLSKVEDQTLVQTLSYGIAFYHEALSTNDKRIIEHLFRLSAIQILVCSRDSCWGLNLQSKLVVIMGNQYFQGRDHRYVDYPMADVLHMMGRASATAGGEMARCVLMCQAVKKDFYKKFLYEGLPVESHLDHFLHDHFNAEIVTKTIENKQDAVDYLTWSFMYRRIAQNPNYYVSFINQNLQGVTNQHISDFLSELVEVTLEDLSKSRCILVDEDQVTPLNLGMIAAYYYINYASIEAFSLSLKPKSKLRGLLEIVSAATEFDDVPIRHHEDSVLKKIYDGLPVKLETANFNDPHFKTNILLQAHFSRIHLPPDLESDQRFVLLRITRLLQACVDVISSNGWLGPALSAMELSQMCVQAMWDRDSPLKQVPHMTPDIIERLKKNKVNHIFDLMEMADADRKALLKLDAPRMSQVAKFVNRYPSVEVEFEAPEKCVKDQPCTVTVSLERENGEDLGPVIAPYYPSVKDEGWWLVVGDSKTKSLYAIKRVHFQAQHTLALQFSLDTAGQTDLVLYFMSDSFMGVDQEFEFSVNVEDDTPMSE